MKKRSAYNPILPSFEYVPDGEPHVFGDRVYLYGSHDRFNGMNFCLNDYICYSASIYDLSDWKYEGVIFKASQDFRYENKSDDDDVFPLMPGYDNIEIPRDSINKNGTHALFAPDVVKGNDGKYYLYYCFDCMPQIGVAVCDTPYGKFEFLGLVKHKDGTILGENDDDLFQFDPGIFIDDDKRVYLYSGNAPMTKDYGEGLNSQVMELEEDMLTLKSKPKVLLPSLHVSEGTGYEGHEFFEASSIRKINNKYYLVYSSIQSHELCYAISDYPDRDYKYGGTIIDIGDIFLNGKEEKDAINSLGNTHGGIENINGKWYVFYHRQTNRTNFSRQGCAESITFEKDGSIKQVEVTSQGLEGKALEPKGEYPANICSHLTGENGAVFAHPLKMQMEYPYLTQDIKDAEYSETLEKQDLEKPIQYVKNIKNNSVIGFKYFDFDTIDNKNTLKIYLEVRGEFKGHFEIYTDLKSESINKFEDINSLSEDWAEIEIGTELSAKNISGIKALYIKFIGIGSLDVRKIVFK